MPNTEIGSAYVSVFPKADKGFDKKVGSGIASNVGAGISAKAVAIGNIVSSAVLSAANAAASGIGSVIGGALSNYANYEQLVGGVETLFSESAAAVRQHADEAFKTAGLSANAYMETVTGFSASLLQSLDGDTAKAAETADRAVRDMSDNANKMGTDMASIQNAYQGFAKQNYTMLDNLKLGYGGTKSEMERLLADASKIAGVEFNIDSYADVIDAIHVMQEEMGIAGTTSEEASSTIEGSVNAMKAAWDNWLTALGGEDADFEGKTQQLVDSIVTAAHNVIPRLGTIIATIITELPSILGEIAAQMPELMAPIGEAIKTVLVAAFGEDTGTAIFDTLTGIVDTIGGALSTLATAVQPVIDAIGNIASGIGERLGPVIETISPGLSTLGDILGGAVAVGFEAIATAVQTVADIISWVWDNVLAPFGEWLSETFGPIVEGIGGFFQGAADVIGGAMDWASGAVTTYGDSMVQTMGGDWQAMALNTSSTFSGISSNVDTAMTTASNKATAAGDKVKASLSFPNVSSNVGTVFNETATNMQRPVDSAVNEIKSKPDEIVSAYSGLGSDISSAVGSIYFPTPHVTYRNVKAGDETVSIPEVNYYASGGFVDGAQLIVAGEAGPEMVLPERGGLMDRFASALSERIGAAQSIVVNLQYDAGEDASALATDLAHILGRKLAMEA